MLRRRRGDNDGCAMPRLRPRLRWPLAWRRRRRGQLRRSRCRALLLPLLLLLLRARWRRRQHDALGRGSPELLMLPLLLLLLLLWQSYLPLCGVRVLKLLLSAPLLRMLAVLRLHQVLLQSMLLRRGLRWTGTKPETLAREGSMMRPGLQLLLPVITLVHVLLLIMLLLLLRGLLR